MLDTNLIKEQSLVDQHMVVCKILNEIYAKKNHDYGNSFDRSLDEWGSAAAGVRISDKYNRFINLLKGGEAQVKESLKDTILDVCNYFIMTYMYLDRNGIDVINNDDENKGEIIK